MFGARGEVPGAAAVQAPVVPRVELHLRTPDGDPWTLSFSPGVEIFIGHYPRLDEIAPEGTLLAFSRTPRKG